MHGAGSKRVVVNADDFGFSPGITEGILRAHREGIVTSTTLAANLPDAERAAARLAEAPGLGVGVHLNACQGPPLSQAGEALAETDGLMRFTATGLILACLRRPALVDAVEAEFDAQIRRVLEWGVRPTHLDSHRHSHAWPPIFRRVVRLARTYGITCVRRVREVLPPGPWPAASAKQRAVARLLNAFDAVNAAACGGASGGARVWATTGTWGIAYTGRIGAAFLAQAAHAVRAGTTEIMVHPGLDLGDLPPGVTTRLRACREAEMAALCDPAVRGAFQVAGVELTHYGRL